MYNVHLKNISHAELICRKLIFCDTWAALRDGIGPEISRRANSFISPRIRLAKGKIRGASIFFGDS